jgi:hypothetical protein
MVMSISLDRRRLLLPLGRRTRLHLFCKLPQTLHMGAALDFFFHLRQALHQGTAVDTGRKLPHAGRAWSGGKVRAAPDA